MPFIISAPSGAGKSTLIKYILQARSDFEFSVSATTRPPRINEIDGKDYYFISSDEFKDKIAKDEFIEYERVYNNIYYGTLKSEISRIENKNHHIVFEVDVKGGIRLKKIFGDAALSIFIIPPSIDVLRERLQLRQTESAEDIEERVTKADVEMQFAHHYDIQIVNDDIKIAQQTLLEEMEKWIRAGKK